MKKKSRLPLERFQFQIRFSQFTLLNNFYVKFPSDFLRMCYQPSSHYTYTRNVWDRLILSEWLDERLFTCAYAYSSLLVFTPYPLTTEQVPPTVITMTVLLWKLMFSQGLTIKSLLWWKCFAEDLCKSRSKFYRPRHRKALPINNGVSVKKMIDGSKSVSFLCLFQMSVCHTYLTLYRNLTRPWPKPRYNPSARSSWSHLSPLTW